MKTSKPVMIMDEMPKVVLPDLTAESAAKGYNSTPMYSTYAWCETPGERNTVMNRNMRKEKEDGR